MDPKFFNFTASTLTVNPAPYATQLDVQLERQVCSVCGVYRSQICEVSTCTVVGGTFWPDVLGCSSSTPCLMSEHAVQGLLRMNASGFAPKPVAIAGTRDTTLRKETAPRYFYLHVDGSIDIHLTASGLAAPRCPACKTLQGAVKTEARALVPDDESWDKSDILKISNHINAMYFCTKTILELARSDRWTNARFDPMDILQRHAVYWGGIDYLGNEWPPKQWYPIPPGTGKSLQEWVQQMKGGDPEATRNARIAIADIAYDKPDEVIPELAQMLGEPSDYCHRHAARMLGLIHFHSGLVPLDIRQRIYPHVSEFLQSKLELDSD